jgi:endonuclease YncB( thermonuclease family)
MYEYGAQLVRTYDGDTATFDVDLGFSIYSRHSIRFAGIDAPELDTPEGKVAREWIREWFVSNPVPYVLRTTKSRDKYGRYLATITSSATGRIANDDIVAAGNAVLYPSKG